MLRAFSRKDRVEGGTENRRPGPSRQDPAEYLAEAGWSRIAEFVWARSTAVPVASIPIRDQYLILNASPEDLLYFDTETTGLSGGSGTMIFLAGLGRLDGSSIRVEQVFLEDYPGEPSFLAYLEERMPEDGTYVSYNGKAFDSNILSMRHLLQGRRRSYAKQLDLLYPARRLWKSILGSCSLGNIERDVLHTRRGMDIPGALIPDTYFDYLRSGDPRPLEPVFEHHREDIVSLHRLLLHIERLAADPFAGDVDRLQLARLLLDKAPSRGEALLRRVSDDDSRAGLTLGYHLKRTGRRDEAFIVFRRVYDSTGNVTAGVEVAKHLEHRVRDVAAARVVVRELVLRPDCAPTRDDLRRRLRRLEAKLKAR
jgi:hypothetical protein